MKKNIIYIGVAALTLLANTACSDYLDMPSKEKFDSQTVFADVDRAEMAVLGCYPRTMHREVFYQLGMGTDECLSTEGETNSKNQVANYVYTPSNSPTGLYTTMYQGIEYANVCIRNLENMKSSSVAEQKKLDHLLGEALSIRAENYLNLIRHFGDVPFITTPTSEASTFYSSRTSRDTIYDHIIADMQRATGLLSWSSENVVGSKSERFTKNAAYGVLARIALYAAGYSLRWDLNTYDASTVRMAQRSDGQRVQQLYQIAADACKAAIEKGENKLLGSYEQVWRNILTKQFDEETMLQVGQYGTKMSSYNIGYTNGIFAHTKSVYLKSGPQMIANPVYYFDFAEGDQRRDVTICNYGYDASNKRQMNGLPSNSIGKFRVDWKSGTGISANTREIDWPVLRYADVLLMYAEALNEVNHKPTPEAVAALKQVRLRAFGGDAAKVGDIPTDYDGFKKFIINERKLELGFECWRKTDLIRWNVLYETLMQNKQDLLDMANLTGRFTHIDRYRAYKPETGEGFEAKTVALPFVSLGTTLSKADSTAYVAQGYKVIDMFSGTNGFVNGNRHISSDTKKEPWMNTSLFRGLEKNKVELLPLSTSNIIDVNKGLTGQQHPLY